MKIAYVNPKFDDALWSFHGMNEITGYRAAFAPLGLATAIALTPEGWDIEVYDEEIGPIDFDTDADVIALTAFNVQASRAFEISTEFRSRGKFVAFGGPYASLCPDKTRAYADALISGECEYIWPEFLNDFRNGRHKDFYRQVEKVDLADSPIPAYERLDVGAYLIFTVQTSRGCPFECEFCDIITTDGRVRRNKPIEHVLKEIEKLRGLKTKYVTFTDANYIGNTKYAEALTRELVRLNQAARQPISFSCQATLNLCRKDTILGLMQKANFETVFIGIESPRIQSLVETKKGQNTHDDIPEAVRKINSYNIMVMAGMIIGFDHDDKTIFQEQFDFLMEAAIPFTTAGLLVAVDNTPLHTRLKQEGRLTEYSFEKQRAHFEADINFIPKSMTLEEIVKGYNWMIRALYSYDNYSARLTKTLQRFTAGTGSARQNNPFMLLVLFNFLKYYLLTRDARRRRFFLETMTQVIRGGLSVRKFLTALTYMALYKHCREYIVKRHGDPETAGSLSPFESELGMRHSA